MLEVGKFVKAVFNYGRPDQHESDQFGVVTHIMRDERGIPEATVLWLDTGIKGRFSAHNGCSLNATGTDTFVKAVDVFIISASDLGKFIRS